MQENIDFDELVDRLKKLAELRDEEVISESEYVRLKTGILDKLQSMQ